MKISEPEWEFDHSDLHFRDQWQFELKSDFFPHPALKENMYTQEFFLFIPDALQINKQSYTRDLFYQDQTNLIRYKTPIFTFEELLDPKTNASPIHRIWELKNTKQTSENQTLIENELKLLGNIVRSALRCRIQEILKLIESHEPYKDNIAQLTRLISDLKETYQQLKDYFLKTWNDPSVHSHFSCVEEFISKKIHNYLVALREHLPKNIDKRMIRQIDQIILKEIEESEKKHREPISDGDHALHNEYILYRISLLNKFMHSVLLLNTNRFSLTKKYRNLIGAISAGIAMSIFLILFIWQGEIVVINSAPFVILTVIFYILKDRIKEGIRNISYKRAFRWFPDYTTQILSPDESSILGKLKESFSFTTEDKLPIDIVTARNREFHFVLETFKRPEQVLYHKKTVSISKHPEAKTVRKYGLNIFFRFNIHRFLVKASNPYDRYVTLDKETKELYSIDLPKVYHLNIIMKNTFIQEDLSTQVELKKYRVVIDKRGIKRVEHLG